MSTDSDQYRLIDGDSLVVLDDPGVLENDSVHAIVTDPPYGINFMPGTTNGWDDFDPHEYQSWCKEWAEKAMRVAKPGGHLLAFSGERTFHRLMCGVEDAGWNVRTSIMWLHGQGFPKGADVSKHIDRYYDAEDDREVVEQWDGWKTQLKPAFEPIVVARKPPSESAVYKNVLEHGTGAYNIDACRIGDHQTETHMDSMDDAHGNNWGNPDIDYKDENPQYKKNPPGRYPANVALDVQAAAMLDAESDDASRFYYSPKASKSERTHDGEVENGHPTVKPTDLMQWLVRLVTAEGQTVLDPFTGSGTTGVACLHEGREFVGIEREAEYREIARQRLADVASDAGQQTLSDAAADD